MHDSPTLLVLSNFGVWREGLAARLRQALPELDVRQANLGNDTELLPPSAPTVILIETQGREPKDLLGLNQLARSAPADCRLLLMVPPELADKAAAYVSRECSFQELLDILAPALHGQAGCRPAELPALLRRLQARSRQIAGTELQPRLTARELEVLALIQEGLGNQAAAERLGLSIHTIKNHVHNILDKLDVRRRTHAVDEAQRRGWLPSPPETPQPKRPQPKKSQPRKQQPEETQLERRRPETPIDGDIDA